MLGFTYNGKHCEELHVKYIPKETQRGDIMSDYETISSERSWVAGGDYYRARVKSRVFELPCYYEDLSRKELEDMVKWLDRRTSGYLIFDERPYARYFVRPTKRIEPKNYGLGYGTNRRYSGTLTITFTAYWPFAELIYTDEGTAPMSEYDEVDLLPAAEMPSSDVHALTETLVYNPGTELGQSIIRFAGSTGSSDLVIRNVANGDECVLKAGLTTATGEYLELNSKTGRVERVTTNGRVLDYIYHDKGYIHFVSDHISNNNLRISQTSGSRVLTSSGAFTEDNLGEYIYIDSGWKYLGTYTSPSSMSMNVNASATKTTRTRIATMNRLTITKGSGANITQLDIICKPEVR